MRSGCSCSAGPIPSTPDPARFRRTSSPSASWGCLVPKPPPSPPPHGLLRDKVVLVTAAAGTGIGFATARRAVEEGATVVLSDWHERRLAEARQQLAGLGGE